MSQNQMFQGEIDPEIAALLGTADSLPGAGQSKPLPKFSDIFAEDASATDETGNVDLTQASFPEITVTYESTPRTDLADPDYYKKCLQGEGDPAQRVHALFQKYLAARDPKDKGVFRQQIVSAMWEFLAGISRKATGTLSGPKLNLLRFGILHPGLLPENDRTLFSKLLWTSDLNQPIYYLDEWLKAIGTGTLKTSMTDEVRVAKSDEMTRIQQLLDKAIGKRDGARNLLKAKSDERRNFEQSLAEKVKQLQDHSPLADCPDALSCYSESQKHIFGEVQELLRYMAKSDKELGSFIQDYSTACSDVLVLEEKARDGGGNVRVDMKAIDTEFETVRQMTKMTVGRQGNHFPVLTQEYFHLGPKEIATRENVLLQLTWLESIDPEAFCRSYKNKMNRIVPFVVLLPNYGEFGICWEPFDRFNRATSRGRIALPMYAKNLQIAILNAVADLRWQVAKEKASYYWMEEGITGNYYQYFQSKKLKGDVKEFFIQDYITWVTKESDGIQKLDKELRGIFWRYIPFSQPIKEKLKGRSYIYQELYQRDVNRSLSDGY